MLELIPRFGSRRYQVRRDGVDVAELAVSMVREAAQVTIDGVPHTIRREGIASGAFTLERDGVVIASARKPSAVRSRFEVEIPTGRRYDLARAAWWGRRFALREGGQPVGTVRPQHAFTRRAYVDLPADMDLPTQVFVAALVTFMWSRDASAGAG